MEIGISLLFMTMFDKRVKSVIPTASLDLLNWTLVQLLYVVIRRCASLLRFENTPYAIRSLIFTCLEHKRFVLRPCAGIRQSYSQLGIKKVHEWMV